VPQIAVAGPNNSCNVATMKKPKNKKDIHEQKDIA
jgi:hypothetical protein